MIKAEIKNNYGLKIKKDGYTIYLSNDELPIKAVNDDGTLAWYASVK